MDDIDFITRVGEHHSGLGVYRVDVPRPPFGCSCFMIKEKGVYRVSSHPGALVSLSCTHVGVGFVEVYDSVCDDSGEVPAGAKMIYKANPQTMCLWLFNAGLNNGLTVKALGGSKTTPVFLTVSWVEI